ncbi:MAG: leucyl/phenylalanyl-tRNA--protein transferase [Alphaproteobacteria bacterium]|nr:leucyl/phenylalanyl-tRNA--protein transferase [Alphaproteobacteria bacterium]
MPIYRIPQQHVFPDPELADPNGLLGVGGDLDPARVLLAYHLGIFPWFSRGQPILWWSPDPRLVLEPSALQIQRSLGKRIRQQPYRITMDLAFSEVIEQCGRVPRPGQDGTWITPGMLRAYQQLFEAGFAHSVEAWEGDTLVGGLYGVSVGSLFAGESMFALRPDASKIAFVHFVRQFERWGGELVDCQVQTEHLARFGAVEIPRADYLARLRECASKPARPAPWQFDDDFVCDGR